MKQPHTITLEAPRKVGLAARVSLEDAATETDTERKWMQVATAGQYLGYRDGTQPFELTREIFQQAIDNIHAHPSFVAGEDGIGVADVIPWDFNHASEMDPTAMAVNGAPAAGWTADLKIVDGPDGVAQLHALTRFLEPARGYVKAGAYKWASIAMAFSATDPVSGDDVGALITSIALTNTPFIEGMSELAASRMAANRYFYEPASGPEQALEWVRSLFGLPAMADASVVMENLERLQGYVDAAEEPVGIDTDDLVGQLRTILGLPVLSEPSAVLDSTREIIQRLMDDVGDESETEPSDPPAADAAATSRRTTMNEEQIKQLAKLLKCTATADAILEHASELVTLRAGVGQSLGVADTAAVAVVLEAAKESVDVRTKLGSLLNALGVEDSDAALDQVASLLEQAKQLTEAMPELEGLRVAQKEAEETQVEEDVAAAMASYGIPESAREGLRLMRTQGDDRKAAREAFLAKFPPKEPAPAAPAPAAILHRTIAAGPDGTEMSVSPDGRSIVLGRPAAPAPAPAQSGSVNLSAYEGRNKIEKAVAYLKATTPGFAEKSWDDQFTAARALVKNLAA